MEGGLQKNDAFRAGLWKYTEGFKMRAKLKHFRLQVDERRFG